MKNFILGAALVGILSVGAQAFAFTPSMTNYAPTVDGRFTLSAQDAAGNPVLVIGGETYPITDGNKVIQVWKIQQQIFDLQRQIAAMPAGDCDVK